MITPNEMSFPKKMKTINISDMGSGKVSNPCPNTSLSEKEGSTEGLDSAMVWESEDFSHTDWYSQGICGMKDEDQLFLLISWYNQSSNIARVSFIKVGSSDHCYVHVLLLDKNKKPFKSHVGGMFKFGDRLYLADTSNGLNYFDTTKILTSVNGFKFSDYGCKYGLKLKGSVNLKKLLENDSLTNPSFSWCDMPRNESNRVFVGSYVSTSDKYKNRTRFVAEFSIDSKNSFHLENCWKNGEGSVSPGNGLPNNTQGMTLSSSTGKKILLASCSGNTAKLNAMKHFSSKGWQVVKSWLWPYGTEDVHISSSGNIWGCTEHPCLRFVFRGKVKTYTKQL